MEVDDNFGVWHSKCELKFPPKKFKETDKPLNYIDPQRRKFSWHVFYYSQFLSLCCFQ